MSNTEVLVVGAGMGGLAAAIDLASAGLRVTVLERGAVPGGKVRQLEVGGQLVDSGPTVLTMRWVFDRLFEDAGVGLDDRVGLRRSELLARHAWDEARLDLYADPERSADALAAFAGPAAARGYQAFRERARSVYQTLESSFILAQRPSPIGLMMKAGGLSQLLVIKPFETLWRELEQFFPDPRLRQLFGRYSTYCGSSPFLAPATLMLVAHVEMAGVWTVDGGMQRLPEAMATLATSLGVQLRYGVTAEEVLERGGRAVGVRLEGGEELLADRVVLNTDAAAIALGKLGRPAARAVKPIPVAERSLSAVTLSLLGSTEGFPLTRHNVFFGGDYPGEFDDVFHRRMLPEDPTVYVCAADRRDDEPWSGPERLFCIINAPADGDQRDLTPAEIEACAQRAFNRLSRCGLSLSHRPETTRITTPADFERRFPGTGGALYGRATHGSMATFSRSSARTPVPGLYVAGGSVHPGPGVPMAAISGRLAAAQLLEDSPSIGRSRRGATSGGTSTRSATTGKRL
jgi:1-hydroxycarotenoid 3,4-desaturase